MSELYKLKDLVELRAGYAFRGKIEPDLNGDHFAIQLKDVDPEQGIHHDQVIQSKLPGRAPTMLFENDDIAFVARGRHNYAVFASGISSPTVLSQHFIHMRLKEKLPLSPEYLTWYLNCSHEAKRHLRKAAQGTALPSITRSMLEDMKVEIPSISIQEKILLIHQTHLCEKHLLQKLIQNNAIANSVISNQLLKEVKS